MEVLRILKWSDGLISWAVREIASFRSLTSALAFAAHHTSIKFLYFADSTQALHLFANCDEHGSILTYVQQKLQKIK